MSVADQPTTESLQELKEALEGAPAEGAAAYLSSFRAR